MELLLANWMYLFCVAIWSLNEVIEKGNSIWATLFKKSCWKPVKSNSSSTVLRHLVLANYVQNAFVFITLQNQIILKYKQLFSMSVGTITVWQIRHTILHYCIAAGLSACLCLSFPTLWVGKHRYPNLCKVHWGLALSAIQVLSITAIEPTPKSMGILPECKDVVKTRDVKIWAVAIS